MKKKEYKYFMCDFETTVYKGQTYTEVWAAACVELYTEEVHIFHSIEEQYNFFKSLDCNVVAYYHNLKFDGAFWLSYLLLDKGFNQAYFKGDTENSYHWYKDKDMPNHSIKYSISDKGQWYTITIKDNRFIELRDSLKLLPFSVKRIGNSFDTKHKKLDMEYEGFRYAGCSISEKEREYIANDVLVVKEALEIMFNEGHSKLTIGSCCLEEYKGICSSSLKIPLEYKEMFPDLYTQSIDDSIYGSTNVGDYIRKSYRGGWCYLVKNKAGKIFKNGVTLDVNSLYPSMMSSESGNRYPVGRPCFWSGNYIPDEGLRDDRYFFIRVKTRFYIKDNRLPFIQIKNSFLYKGTECLETTDILDKDTGIYYSHYIGENGKLVSTPVTMTLTMTDYYLLLEQYELVDFEILDGCWFYTLTGLFDEYIEKYKKIKQESVGAKRELAKLFLNNLYGKMASSVDSSFKIAYIKEDKSIGFIPVFEQDKKPGYIPIGSAITSYARNFTIRAAQSNFYGGDKSGFIYADTDSIHCDLSKHEIKGVTLHDKDFCCWKVEGEWDKAIFARQKTYIEHITSTDSAYNNIKCAGMPDKAKHLFDLSLSGTATLESNDFSDDEKEFLFDNDGNLLIRTYEDFKVGLKVPGKLLPKRIRGGIVLADTSYEMR